MAGNNILLQPLVELDPPLPVSMFPQTIGWKVLLALFFLFVCFFSYKKITEWRCNRYRREAIKALLAIAPEEKSQKIRCLNRILKETASVGFGVTRVAGLYGQEWLSFLEKTSDISFQSTQAEQWQLALYDPNYSDNLSDEELNLLIEVSRQWINQHEVTL